MLVRVAHLSSSACRGAKRGIGMVQRIRTFMARLVLTLQCSGFATLVERMAAFRDASGGIARQHSGECMTVLSVVHS